MARNGSGTYSLPSGNPVVTGTTISSTTHNNTMSDIATALTQSIAKDGQTTPSANLPMGTYRHTGVGNAADLTDYASASQVLNGSLTILSSVSGTDTITANAAITPSSYADGQMFSFIAAGANTGAATLNVSSLGAKSITKNGTTALAAGDIPSGAVVLVRYDGTQFQLIGATALTASTVLPDGVTATTQSAGDNSTKIATTAYVDSAVPTLSSISPTVTTSAYAIDSTCLGKVVIAKGGNTGTIDAAIETAGSFFYLSTLGQGATANDVINNSGTSEVDKIAPEAFKLFWWDDSLGTPAWQSILIDAQPFDLSTATADVHLEIGQEGYKDISASTSEATNIATGEHQEYDWSWEPTGSLAANNQMNLQPNNTTYASAFRFIDIYYSSALAGSNTTYNDFQVFTGPAITFAKGKLGTTTTNKWFTLEGLARDATLWYGLFETSYWNNTTIAWSSLGTWTFAVASTGRLSFRRTR